MNPIAIAALLTAAVLVYTRVIDSDPRPRPKSTYRKKIEWDPEEKPRWALYFEDGPGRWSREDFVTKREAQDYVRESLTGPRGARPHRIEYIEGR